MFSFLHRVHRLLHGSYFPAEDSMLCSHLGTGHRSKCQDGQTEERLKLDRTLTLYLACLEGCSSFSEGNCNARAECNPTWVIRMTRWPFLNTP